MTYITKLAKLSLHNRVEPFAALFGDLALGNVLANT